MGTSYTDLRTVVQDYTANTFTDTDFAYMTQLAEQKIYNSVHLPIMRKTGTLSMAIGVPQLSAPADFLAPYSMGFTDASGNYTYLINKDLSFIREAYPNSSTLSPPKYYAIQGPQTGSELLSQFILGPSPNSTYSVDLVYSYYPASIVTASNTWLSTNFFSVLVNGVLVEAGRYMKEEQDVMAMYADQYKQSLTLFKNMVDGKLGQDVYKAGQVHTEVI